MAFGGLGGGSFYSTQPGSIFSTNLGDILGGSFGSSAGGSSNLDFASMLTGGATSKGSNSDLLLALAPAFLGRSIGEAQGLSLERLASLSRGEAPFASAASDIDSGDGLTDAERDLATVANIDIGQNENIDSDTDNNRSAVRNAGQADAAADAAPAAAAADDADEADDAEEADDEEEITPPPNLRPRDQQTYTMFMELVGRPPRGPEAYEFWRGKTPAQMERMIRNSNEFRAFQRGRDAADNDAAPVAAAADAADNND